MRTIKKPLRMAWFEYEEFGDAVAFTQITTSRAGFENVLTLLPRDPSNPRRRVASNLPGLDIGLRAHSQGGRRLHAFVASPQTRHGALLSETVLSLGVRGTELVNDASFDEGLDLVVVSGPQGLSSAGAAFHTLDCTNSLRATYSVSLN